MPNCGCPIINHYEDFKKLAALADRKTSGQTLSKSDLEFLAEIEERDDIFPELEIKWFASVDYPAEKA
jgi:hypothetical protein